MDVVKAVINLREGVLELEGPQEFVERYLDQYQPIIEKGFTSTSIPHVTSKETKVEKAEKPAPKRTRTTKSKAGPTCTQKVQELLNEGYFKQPKTRADVQSEILNRGVRFESKEVSAVLNNFFNGGKLKRTGTGTQAQYYSNV